MRTMRIVCWRGTVAFSDAQLTLVGVAWMTSAAPTALGLVSKSVRLPGRLRVKLADCLYLHNTVRMRLYLIKFYSHCIVQSRPLFDPQGSKTRCKVQEWSQGALNRQYERDIRELYKMRRVREISCRA